MEDWELDFDSERESRLIRYALEDLDDDEIEQSEFDYLEDNYKIQDIILYVKNNEPSIYNKYIEESLTEADVYCLLTQENISKIKGI